MWLSARRRREELAPFQAAEAIDVRRKSDAFGERVDAYRAFFLQKAPFAVPTTDLSLEQVGDCRACGRGRAGAGRVAGAAAGLSSSSSRSQKHRAPLSCTGPLVSLGSIALHGAGHLRLQAAGRLPPQWRGGPAVHHGAHARG